MKPKPAFPYYGSQDEETPGLTDLELFAAMAMQGMMANTELCRSACELGNSKGMSMVESIASFAVGQGTALKEHLDRVMREQESK